MVGQHELNKESSRSHAIFTLHLERSSGARRVARDHAGSVIVLLSAQPLVALRILICQHGRDCIA